MILVEKHQTTKTSPFFNDCDLLSYISKNLYNSCLYYIRQYYFNNSDNLLKPKIVNNKQMNYWVFDKFTDLLPNPKVSIEVGKFDIAKMNNPK